ncbi:MAG: putative Ig domain-containing protein [Eubacteriales bacterium]
MKTKIAHTPEPFAGKPAIHAPARIGCSPEKPFLWRIPATGERPMKFTADRLPAGLTLDQKSGILSGSAGAGEYPLTVTAANAHGSAQTNLLLTVKPDGVGQTPLLGWTSWNAFRNAIDEPMIRETARLLVENGLADYGYRYVNIDSGWQGAYGGIHDAVMPSEKFPDMKALADDIHEKGLCLGIYSTPMAKAWGGGEYPGCTRYPDHTTIQFVVAEEHYEKNNVAQWVDWGIDYLKYDWTPCEGDVADLMKRELLASPRDFAFCTTVDAKLKWAEYWRENCTSWRHNPDSDDNWDCVCRVIESADVWLQHIRPGHFFDLDMLETGYFNGHQCQLTEDEQLAAFSIRAFCSSPIQISCDLSKLTPFDRDMLCNDEILALNQDTTGVCAIQMNETRSGSVRTRIYTRPVSGGLAAAFFNMGEECADLRLALDKTYQVRDLWAKENLDDAPGFLTLTLEPHTVRMVKLTEK